MIVAIWTILILLALLLVFAAALATTPNPMGTPSGGIVYGLGRLYLRIVHRFKVEGKEHFPPTDKPGPMIVVANHTAGIDPILVSGSAPFEIRWIMAEDMRVSWLQWLWDWHRVIFVGRPGKREKRDMGGMREAMRHLKGGGVVGIFPEGGLERPAKQILPFLGGVGLLISKSKATVLPVLITGTPAVDPAWASLWRPSKSRVTYGEPIDYTLTELGAAAIAVDLRARFVAWSGWPSNDGEDEKHAERNKPKRGAA